jgi:hypothetical protein
MINPNEKIYIAGPMKHIAGFNHVNFDLAESWLRANYQCRIISPAAHARLQMDLDYDDFMEIGKTFVRICDVIFMLVGWENSSGAVEEHQLAVDLGKRIIYQSDLVFQKYSETIIDDFYAAIFHIRSNLPKLISRDIVNVQPIAPSLIDSVRSIVNLNKF